MRYKSKRMIPAGTSCLVTALTVGLGCNLTLPAGRLVPNTNPTADAGSDRNAQVGQRVTLGALGSNDADDDPLTYLWQQTMGPPVMLDNLNSAEPSFLVPEDNAVYEFSVTVTDGRGGSDDADVRISVGSELDLRSPRADAGAPQAVNEGSHVTLRGGNSSDPSGLPLTYEWIQLSGPPVSLALPFTAEPTFTAPQVTFDATLTFELTVHNGDNLSHAATTVVTVRNIVPPVELCEGVFCPVGSTCDPNTGDCVAVDGCAGVSCAAGLACDPATGGCVAVDACAGVSCPAGLACDPATGGCVAVDACAGVDCPAGSACDPATGGCVGVDACAGVDCPAGSACHPATGVCTDTAPCAGVTCPSGQACNAGACVPVNVPPTANAGDDKTANEGTTVYLTGSGSDPGGGAPMFQWTQLGQPLVTLAGSGLAVSFMAPSVAADTELTFKLTATDSMGLSATDTVKILVKNIDPAGVQGTVLVAPTTLTPAAQIGQTPASQTFGVRNSGSGTLHYTISVATASGGNWLTVSPASGTSMGEVDTINVTYSPAGLTAGTHTATITVSDPASTNLAATVAVTLTLLGENVLAPTIDLDVPTFGFEVVGNGSLGEQPQDRYFRVRNSGDVVLNYTVSADQTWIQFDPPTGATGGNWQTIKVTFEGAELLPVGEHTATISVSDPMATNNPQTVPLVLRHVRAFQETLLDSDQLLSSPQKLAVDPAGNLYVASQYNHKVYVFFPNGAVIDTIGTGQMGSGNGQFNQPGGVAVDATGNIYVSEVGNHRVQKFDPAGSYVQTWGIQGENLGQFHAPSDLAVDSTGNVYVADTYNYRIQRFTPASNPPAYWAWATQVQGSNQSPYGIFIDAQDRVYVALQSAINEYSSAGGLVRSIPVPAAGSVNDITTDSNGTLYAAVNGSQSYEAGHYVTTARLLVFELQNGLPIGHWSGQGSDDGEHGSGANSVIVGANGVLYSSDPSNNRLIKWTP